MIIDISNHLQQKKSMHPDGYKEKELTTALVRIVNNRKGEKISIEQILNEAGVTRPPVITIYDMVEVRALVLYALGIGRYGAELREALIYFIAANPVFRWSELRHGCSDPEQAIEALLHELKYVCRVIEINGDQEYVWSSRWVSVRTIKKELAARERVGDPAFFEYLNYKPRGITAHEL
ncbi:hypothetical protein SG34_004110 [Thalassomonas viridans]|uniref:Uncharacterized protein n=1 Tax=Thalassomonas viridans TaxID=137584 RepID=A0AAE9Z3Y2_9GAMM|nr:hypothetical protein [Thalassomonas viridans]WDE06123.1 hypothetical protein SG34_004110 [Thalassomonas viridans]